MGGNIGEFVTKLNIVDGRLIDAFRIIKLIRRKTMALIFVVDDSHMQCKATAKVLEALGHEVVCLNSGEESVKESLEQLPDLILMDVVMPEMNGFQATREITRNKYTAHIPIVLISGKDQDTDRAWGERQGAKGYLVKPVDEKELVDVVNATLEEYK